MSRLDPRIGMTGQRGAVAAVALVFLELLGAEPAWTAAAREASRTRALDVTRLTASEATRRTPVRLSGTVVYADEEWGLLALADASGTVFVDAVGLGHLPYPGTKVTIVGQTGLIGATPAVVSAQVTPTGTGSLPRFGGPGITAGSDAPIRWVEVFGVVRGGTWRRGHCLLEIATEGDLVEAVVPGMQASRPRSLVDSEVGLMGVFERERSGLHRQRLWVPSWDQVTIAERPRSRRELPILDLAEIDRLAAVGPPPHCVRVRGQLVERLSPQEYTIEQGGHRLVVRGLRSGVSRDMVVDLKGFLEFGPAEPRLLSVEQETVAFPGVLDPPLASSSDLPTLTRLADVRALSAAQARRGQPVRVVGVVTLFYPEEDLLFIQDDTAGVYVSPIGVDLAVRGGQRVLLRGRTAAGALAPIVATPSVEVLPGRGSPAVRRITAARLYTGEDDCHLVEIEGRVRRAEVQDDVARLAIESEGLRVTARIDDATLVESDMDGLVGARVRLRGVNVTNFDWQLRFVGVELHVPGLDAVKIVEGPPADAPLRPIQEILRPLRDAPSSPRVRVRGEVLLQSPAYGLFLRDQTGSLYVGQWDGPPLHPGDRAEATGFAAPAGRTPRLEDALVRIVGRGTAPRPVVMDIGQIVGEARSGELVRLTARLIESVVASATATLLLQSGENVFEAVLERHSAESPLADLTAGSLLEVTGVALTDPEALRGPSVLVVLRSSSDVRILQGPPWWTPARAAGVLATLLLVGSSGLLWALTLRREVRRQTARVESQLVEVRDSEAQYRTLFDAAGDGILILRDEIIVDCNERTQEIFGGSRSALLGKTPWELSPPIQPDGSDSMVAARERLRPESLEKSPHFEWRHRRLDGTELDTELSLAPVQLGGVIHAQAIVRDVTERKATQTELQRLAAAVEYADESIVITDVDARILYVNPAFERITLYSRAEVLGRNPRLLQSGRHDAGFYQTLWHTLRAGKTWGGRFTNRRKDGTLILEEVRISPIADGRGGRLGFVSIARDVTREVEAARRVAELRKMDALGTLAGGIAHDFNNILFAILGYVDLSLRKVEPSSELAPRLEAIRAGARRAADLTRQILAFSRRSSPDFRPTRVHEVADEVLGLLRASLPSTIEIRSHLETTGAVMADSTQLHQVLMNLGANAGLAMRDRGGVLELQVAEVGLDEAEAARLPRLEAGRYVRITMTDTGVGMAPEVLSRIFEPFYTTRTQGEGTGMGLAVVHGIVLDHRGAITAESVPGQGSRFAVYLPAIDLAPGEADIPEAGAPSGTEHVLLVEDEEALRAMLGEMLEGLGYRVTRCANGREALAVLGRDPDAVDLVLSDLTMPEMAGDRLAREAQALRPDLPILLCTGFGEPWTTERARTLGAREVLRKPLSLATLARAVRTALDS